MSMVVLWQRDFKEINEDRLHNYLVLKEGQDMHDRKAHDTQDKKSCYSAYHAALRSCISCLCLYFIGFSGVMQCLNAF